MRKFTATALTALLLSASVGTAFAQGAQPGQYQIDPTHTLATFEVGHLGFSKMDGRFNQIEGVYTIDAKGNGTVKVEIPVTSIDTNHTERDAHLRNKDFFDVEKYPVMSFEGKKLNDQLQGKLTMRGVTKDVSFKVQPIGAGNDPWGKYRSGFQATTVIKRSDFGINFMPQAIPDEVSIKLNVEGIKQ